MKKAEDVIRLFGSARPLLPLHGKYLCSGPDGWFVCEDLELARRVVNEYDNDDDWTITQM